MTAAFWNGLKKTGLLVAKPGQFSFFSPPSAEILQANDLLTQGVLLYKQVMEGRVIFGNTVTSSVGDLPVSRGMWKEASPCFLPGHPANSGEEMDLQNILCYGVEIRGLALCSLSRKGWIYVAGLCHMCHHDLTGRRDPSSGYPQEQMAILRPGFDSSSH